MTSGARYALRTLGRSPGFSAVAVATLALGIAANTAIFSLFYQVLLRTLPVREPARLVVLHSDGPSLPGGNVSSDNSETVFSYPLYLRLREGCRSFEGLAARSRASVEIGVEGAAAERGSAEVVSGNFFETLGVRPVIGRLLTAGDDTARGGNAVVVLSFDLWTRRFGASASAASRKILINRQSFTVIGVAPEGFRGVLAGRSPSLYVPISMMASLTPGWNEREWLNAQWLTLLGRLAPGASRSSAEAELQPQYAAFLRDEIDRRGVRNQRTRERLAAKRVALRPASGGLNELERRWRNPLYALAAMVSLLLLVGCANLANLLTARAVNRAHEIRVRLALGAGRARVFRLLLGETLVVAFGGALCGLLLTPVLTQGLLRLLPPGSTGGWISSGIGPPAAGLSALLMLVVALLCGLPPAWQATREDVSSLGERALSTRIHARARKALVVAQIAFSLVMLAVAGLFARSLTNLMRHNLGFSADHLLTFSVDPGLGGYSAERAVALYTEIRRRIETLPGVESVSLADASPLSGSESTSNIFVEGYTQREDEDALSDYSLVGPAYFHTLATPLIAGRDFEERDDSGAPKVVIVNQAFVRRFFGSANPLGRHVRIGGSSAQMEIVGVAADLKSLNLRDAAKPTFYVPYAQTDLQRVSRAAFLVRAGTGFESLPGAVRAVVARLDSSLPVFAMQAMDIQVEASISTDRLIAALSAAFGILATLLTAVGLYGVISYLVSRRTAEIGIRMALGARRSGVAWLVLREVSALALIGAAVGTAGSLAAGRAVESQLFGVRGIDPMILLGAPLTLAAVALLAGGLPALRASRIEPLQALRHD